MKNEFPNPGIPAADPFVLLYQGKYYLYCTIEKGNRLKDHNSFDTAVDRQNGYYVYVSEDLQSWENKGFCLRAEDVMGDQWFWAPEVMHRNGKFYMVYTAQEHIGMAVADSPLGPFKQTEKRWLYGEKAIDGHLFADEDGTVYLYYVRLDRGNRIFVAKLSEDLLRIDTLYEDCLVQAEEPWETVDCLVAEGPFVLKHKGMYYLTYSANHTRCQDYAVGVALSESPIGPFRKFEGNPILRGNERFCGVGHHSFTTSPDGETLLCAYHCHHSLNSFRPRRLCLNTARFVSGEDDADRLVIDGPG